MTAPVGAPGLGAPPVGSLAQPISAGVVSALSGFASSFALLIAGIRAVGGTAADAASALLVLSLLSGILSLALSLATRLPLAFAWSTPGAALLVAAQGTTGSYANAVGAFLLCGVLIAVTGIVAPLARAMTRIPKPIANGMLAGILFPICLAPVKAAVQLPLLAVPVIVVWLICTRFAPRWAIAAAVVATAIVVALTSRFQAVPASQLLPQLTFTLPAFDPLVLLGLGVPLFIVTTAGQNVPGFAVLSSFDYRDVPARTMLVGSGAGTAVGSVFGAFSVNLSALTAAMVVGPGSHPDPRRRFVATVTSGTAWIVLGLAAGLAAALVTASPPVLITAVAGLALLGALVHAVASALEQPEHRLVAIATFLVVASGIAIAGVGSAFWGLVVGGLVMLWLAPWRTRRTRRAGDASATD